MSPILNLDADQSRAAAHRQGTACVAAAAGSGKTTLLVGRAIQLVESGANPREVVTLCFNVNAANTLRERLGAHPATASQARSMASTFHAMGRAAVSLVRRGVQVLEEGGGRQAQQQAEEEEAAAAAAGEAPRAGEIESAPVTVRDVQSATWARLRGDTYTNGRWVRNPRKESWPEWMRKVTEREVIKYDAPARELMFDGERTHSNLLVPERRADLLAKLRTLPLKEITDDQLEALSYFMPAYRAAKADDNYIDYPDMLLGWVYYLTQNNQAVLDQLSRVKHLQIDEAQDGSRLRWYIAKRHAQLRRDGSTLAVGDLRQSIAGFAGARPELFQQWWDEADAKYTLPRNYRSASYIVEAGNAVARGESWNLGGDCIAGNTALGMGSVTVADLGPDGIAAAIAQEIAEGRITIHPTRRARGAPTYTVAVLARTRAALHPVSFFLRARQLYTRMRGGGDEGVWVGGEGRAVRARYALQEGIVPLVPMRGQWVPDYAGTAMAINSDKNRFASTDAVQRWAVRVKEATLPDGSDAEYRLDQQRMLAHSREREAGRPAKGARAAQDVAAALSDFLDEGAMTWEERTKLVEEAALKRIDADTEGARIPGRDGPRGEVVRALIEITRVLDNLSQLQTVVEADSAPPPPGRPVVELVTIHSSKGDEWGTVYLANANDGLAADGVHVTDGVLPHAKAKEPEDVAEELRLLYVAVTRPVHTLVVDTDGQRRFKEKLKALANLAARSQTQPAEVQSFTPPPPPAPEVVVSEPAAPPPATAVEKPDESRLPTAAAMKTALLSSMGRAEALTAAGAKPAAGKRAVPVTWSDLMALLDAVGFRDGGVAYGQRTLRADLQGGYYLKVNTGIPPGAEVARGVGEDSIRVTLVGADDRAKAPKQPIVARTVNWRPTLLTRLVEALSYHPDFHR